MRGHFPCEIFRFGELRFGDQIGFASKSGEGRKSYVIVLTNYNSPSRSSMERNSIFPSRKAFACFMAVRNSFSNCCFFLLRVDQALMRDCIPSDHCIKSAPHCCMRSALSLNVHQPFLKYRHLGYGIERIDIYMSYGILCFFVDIIELSEVLQRTTQRVIQSFAPHERP